MTLTLIRSFLAALTLASLGLSSALAQTTERVSVDSVGVQGNAFSGTPSISSDGRYVAFLSNATNLVPGDANHAQDVFVRDTHSGQTTRVSVDSAGVEGNASSAYCAISGDGRYVAFASEATNLVTGDTNATSDVFLHDRLTGQTTRVSVDSTGAQANGPSIWLAISSDGSTIGFASLASNLVQGDTNNESDVFLHDIATGLTTRVSVDSFGGQARGEFQPIALSSNGRFTAFQSQSPNLVANDNNGKDDVFVHDRVTGQTTRVSLASGGTEANESSHQPSISADGRYVAFHSFATNLVSGDFNGVADIFVNDSQSGQTTRVSVDSAGIEGNNYSYTASISDDGRYVAFLSPSSNLIPVDGNGAIDTFVHDVQTGETSRVSVDSSGVEGNNGSQSWHAISGDGNFVAFESGSTNLVPGDTNAQVDVFIHKLGPITFSLAKSGACPGAMTLTVTMSTPNRNVALVYGPAGNFVKSTPPCIGLVLSISQPTLGAYVLANAAGTATLSFYAPPAVCGLTVQAVDVTSCTATNAVVL